MKVSFRGSTCWLWYKLSWNLNKRVMFLVYLVVRVKRFF